ncbi:bifunctional oligoribonuclease/PAP phosphatase NrnA [Candidatus Peregrinibacteria bacterium]|nr:bifunctional oligoribonuclease/PAP phosphatase NrnA [Candidatus Peregrinibacteria bacterium]
MDDVKIYRDIQKALEKSENILIITHKKPDGDALGSSCGFHHALRLIGKKNTMACIDTAPEYLKFLPGIDELQNDFNLEEYDVVVTLDCGAFYMSKFHEKHENLFSHEKRTVINIDHHPSNDFFGNINLVDTHAASTSIIIYKLLQFFQIPLNRDIASCLLTGIYTDTGSFMHSNTTSEVYKIAADLIKHGGKFRQIAKNCFCTTPITTMKLWGKILNNIKINEDGIIMSVATQEDMKETHATQEDISGVIDLLNSISDAKMSVLLAEDDHGNVKGSFRTQKEDVDLSKIAGVFGGGGHKKAAGFMIPGRLEKEVRWKIVSQENKEKNFM